VLIDWENITPAHRLKRELDDVPPDAWTAVVNFYNAPPDIGCGGAGFYRHFPEKKGWFLVELRKSASVKTPSATTREALELECQKALLTVALDALDKTPAEATELRRLFPQNLLEDRQSTPEETTPTNPVT
jgi:hypothetical protein